MQLTMEGLVVGHMQLQGQAQTSVSATGRRGDTVKASVQMCQTQIISGLDCLQLTQVLACCAADEE